MREARWSREGEIEVRVDAGVETDKRPWFGGVSKHINQDEFSFAVMGDRCGMATEGVFERALDLLKELKPDFVLTVGDMIEGYWRDTADANAEWDEFDVKIETFGLPFFPAVGNHDYSNRLMADVWRERKGPTYYAFRVGDALFLTLNTEEAPDELPDAVVDAIKRATDSLQRKAVAPENVGEAFFADLLATMPPEQLVPLSKVKLSFGEAQLKFVERTLAEHADAKRTFVTMHKPGWKTDREDYDRLVQLLEGRAYTMFAGHLHALEYEERNGNERIQMGRTGGLAHGDGTAPCDANMILWVTVRGGKPTYRVLPLESIHDIKDYIPKSEAVSEGV
jgi:predicted phosphodiesterase